MSSIPGCDFDFLKIMKRNSKKVLGWQKLGAIYVLIRLCFNPLDTGIFMTNFIQLFFSWSTYIIISNEFFKITRNSWRNGTTCIVLCLLCSNLLIRHESVTLTLSLFRHSLVVGLFANIFPCIINCLDCDYNHLFMEISLKYLDDNM